MFSLDQAENIYVISAFVFQIVLLGHFALRKWRFDQALRFGPVVYALSIPAFCVSFALLLDGISWAFWLGGFIYLAWAIFGYTVEYLLKIKWRTPPYWPVFAPYIFLYLATVMFYWWPLKLIFAPLWYGYAFLFIMSTILNVTSHQRPVRLVERSSLRNLDLDNIL